MSHQSAGGPGLSDGQKSKGQQQPPHQMTPLDNFRVQTQIAAKSGPNENAGKVGAKSSGSTTNTTNLTLNMNFNLQQSTIQMQQLPTDSLHGDLHGQKQRMFASPRQPQTMHHASHLSPQAYSKNQVESAQKAANSKQNSKSNRKVQRLGQISGESEVHSASRKQSTVASPPPLNQVGKVKKIKMNKLNEEQLSQIRLHQNQNKVDSASLGGLPQQSKAQKGRSKESSNRTGSVGQMSQGGMNLNAVYNGQQQNHHMMQQQQIMTPEHLAFLQHQQQHFQQVAMQQHHQARDDNRKAKSNSKMSNNNGIDAAGNANSQSRQLESESQLGRKRERPTVAQILQIGESQQSANWKDDQSVPAPPQIKNPNAATYNSTVTSNFDSLGSSSNKGGTLLPNTHKVTKNKAASNLMNNEFRSRQVGQSLTHQSDNMPQLKSVKNSKSRTRNLVGSNEQIYNMSPQPRQSQVMSPQGLALGQQQNSTNMRNIGAKMYYSDGGRIAQAQADFISRQQNQQQQQVNYMPLLVDINSQQSQPQHNQQNNGQNGQDNSQNMFSRLQHQFLEQSAVIRHPQMGELPVIQMTQQQLNSMIEQAAQHRHNVQQLQQQQTQAHNNNAPIGGYQFMGQMAAAQGLQNTSPMAFAIQIQNPQQNGGHKPRVNNGSSRQANHTRGYSEGLPHPQGHPIQLPSLRQQNQISPLEHHQSNIHAQSVPAGSTNGGGYGIANNFAPVKKMTLNSRGKSVPRSTIKVGSDHEQDHIETINELNHPQSTNHQQMMRQPQLQQDKVPTFEQMQNHPMISVGNLTSSGNKGNSFFQGSQLTPLNHNDNMTNDGMKMAIKKGHRGSMQIGQGEQIYLGQQPHQSGQDPNQMFKQQQMQNHIDQYNPSLRAFDGLKSQGGQSRNQNMQSERSSQRGNTQGGSNMQVHGFHNQNQSYIPQKGPLSDLIMTQQSNLNVISLQSGSALRKGKGKQSSFTVNTTNEGQEGPESCSHQDMNGGVPYIFENHKISHAIHHDDFKQQRQHYEMGNQIIAADYEDMKGVNGQTAEIKVKKTKGRKAVNQSQRDKPAKPPQAGFGVRQFSQQPPIVPGIILPSQDQRIGMPGKDKKKKAVGGVHSVPNEMSGMEQQFDHEATLVTLTAQPQQVMQVQQQQPHVQPKAKRQSNKNLNEVVTAASNIGQPGTQDQSLAEHGTFAKTLQAACTKYYKSKNNSRMTPHKYRNGISTRLLVAKETFAPKRAKLPVLILNIDGALGFFDEAKHYNLKEKCLSMLQSLSHNFKIVAFSSESKGLLTRFGKCLTETKTPFAFDAMYQIQRKQTQNMNRVNLTHVILDYSGDDEEDLDLFVSSNIVLVTVDKLCLGEKFESQDLRETFDFDKEYLKGPKAPLIFRLPHARTRPASSLVFETLFQMLTCLLITSRVGAIETTSFFTYNDRTKNLTIPSSDKGIVQSIIPDKMKLVDKAIQQSKSLRFIMAENATGLNLHKGFKQLTEVYRGNKKPEWLEFNYRIFKPLLPLKMRLQKITQTALQGAEPPTGKKLMVRCENEEATRKYQVFTKKNEVIRKHIRKYRARYWAVNQIEDPNHLDEENQDIVGELIDNSIVAPAIGDVIPEEPSSPKLPDTKADSIASGKEQTADQDQQKASNGENGDSNGQQPPATTNEEDKEDAEGKLGGGGECSSSSEDSDSDNEHYDDKAPAVKFKVIDIKQPEDAVPVLKKQQTMRTIDPNKLVKIECRKLTKPKVQYLLDFCSKKQNSMMFTTSQPQHLLGAQAQQIENQIADLVAKLNETVPGKKEVVNYDF